VTAVAAAFLILVAARVVLMRVDDGFGGAAWTVICYVSCGAWPLGVVLALNVLGWWPSISVGWHA
jgi:hypothetical protein